MSVNHNLPLIGPSSISRLCRGFIETGDCKKKWQNRRTDERLTEEFGIGGVVHRLDEEAGQRVDLVLFGRRRAGRRRQRGRRRRRRLLLLLLLLRRRGRGRRRRRRRRRRWRRRRRRQRRLDDQRRRRRRERRGVHLLRQTRHGRLVAQLRVRTRLDRLVQRLVVGRLCRAIKPTSFNRRRSVDSLDPRRFSAGIAVSNWVPIASLHFLSIFDLYRVCIEFGSGSDWASIGFGSD